MRVPWNRGGLRTYLMLIGLLAGHATPRWIASGTPLLLIGVAIHLWAKGCLHQDAEVTTAGPYRFVRHPFYVGNAFLDLGIAVMSGWWILQLTLPLWWLAVYLPTMRREEGTLTRLFGVAYTEYRERVPLLVPYRRPLSPQPLGFSWQNPNLPRTEWPRAFRFVSYPLIFAISHRLRSDGLALLFHPTVFDVLLVTGCVALWAVRQELRKHFKRRQPILPSWVLSYPSRFAILAVTVAVGYCVTGFEVEAEWAVFPPGLALLTFSAIARRGKPGQRVVGEALLAVGLALLFELPWIAVLAVPPYLAIVLDFRLTAALPGRRACVSPRSLNALSGMVFDLLLGVGTALALAKEFTG